MIYVTGDCHGNVIQRLSYKKHPYLRDLNQNDTLIILGDIGLYWPGYEKETEYQLREISSKPFRIICIAGNHDNYDYFKTMTLIFPSFLESGEIKIDERYPNIYWIDKAANLVLYEKSVICISGAKSHDYKYIYEKNEKNLIKSAKKLDLPYHINHVTWWKEEKIDIDFVKKILKPKYNFVLTHDAPAKFNKIAKTLDIYNEYEDNEGELFFDYIDDNISFDYWYHGHYHFEDYEYLNNHKCIYHSIKRIA